ncbi:hypothetical protein STEG23_003777, partial [Scotinomys teguina]
MEEEDTLEFLDTGIHLSGTNLDCQMQYIYKSKSDSVYVINLKRTWEKPLLAAPAVVAIENPADVSVISSRNTGQRAVLNEVCCHHWIHSNRGCFTPGTFTNQIQAAFKDPCLLVGVVTFPGPLPGAAATLDSCLTSLLPESSLSADLERMRVGLGGKAVGSREGKRRICD